MNETQNPGMTGEFYDWNADDWRGPGTGDIAVAELAARQSAASADVDDERFAPVLAAAGEVHRSIAAFLEVVENLPPELAERFSVGQAVPLALAALRGDDGFGDDDDATELAGMLAVGGGRGPWRLDVPVPCRWPRAPRG